MQHFGVLRIDHIMGLFRLWLIPEGKSACDGLYVHYPFAELMAILAIESQRNQCLIVGEDLGTVPNEVRFKLDEFKVFSYFCSVFLSNNTTNIRKQIIFLCKHLLQLELMIFLHCRVFGTVVI